MSQDWIFQFIYHIKVIDTTCSVDEERLFGIPEGEDVDEITANSPEYQQWEQFAEVATNLLEKIEKYLETLQTFGVDI